MNCCDYHGVNCNQGRKCPARQKAAYDDAVEMFYDPARKDDPITSPYQFDDAVIVIALVLGIPLGVSLLAWAWQTWPVQLALAEIFS